MAASIAARASLALAMGSDVSARSWRIISRRAALLVTMRGASPVAEFTEVESGRKTDRERPELAKAIEACRLYRARLVVAKLDRLARNAYFLHQLKAAGVTVEHLVGDWLRRSHGER